MSEQPLPRHIRRSLLALPVDDPQLGEKAYASWADAIVLDFVRKADRDWQKDLRERMPAAIRQAARGGAEVFVRVASDGAAAELDATVFSGMTGILMRGVNGADEIAKAGAHLDALEESRGIAGGSLEIDVEVTTAAGVWNALEIARATPRFGTFTIDEAELCRNLGMAPEPALEFEPLEYIKSQLITVAIAGGGQAQGMSYPLSLTQKNTGDEELRQAVKRARDTGFKGALCAHAAWIKVCNDGFRPSPDEIAFYRKVREVFAEGLKRGMASVPMEGKMIDVPVDLRAKVYLEWADRVEKRDEAKARAHEKGAGT